MYARVGAAVWLEGKVGNLSSGKWDRGARCTRPRSAPARRGGRLAARARETAQTATKVSLIQSLESYKLICRPARATQAASRRRRRAAGRGGAARAPIRGSSALLASESRPSPHPLVRVSTYCSRDGVASRRRASSARGPPPSDKPPTESFRMGKTPIGRQERNLKQGGDHAPQLSPCRIKTYRVFVLSDKTRYRL